MRRSLVAAVLALLVCVVPPSEVRAAGTTIRTASAGAFFDIADPTGCTHTTIDISGSATTINGVVSFAAETFIARRNVCVGAELIRASERGTQAVTFQLVNMSSGSLSGTFEVFDFVTGTIHRLEVQLAWRGTGAIERTVTAYQSTKFRNAKATGVIKLDGVVLANGRTTGSLNRVTTQIV